MSTPVKKKKKRKNFQLKEPHVLIDKPLSKITSISGNKSIETPTASGLFPSKNDDKTSKSWICSHCKTVNINKFGAGCKSCQIKQQIDDKDNDNDEIDQKLNTILSELHKKNVSNTKINSIKAHLSEEAYDYESFVSDLSDVKESWLIVFFRDTLHDTTLFYKLNFIIKQHEYNTINNDNDNNNVNNDNTATIIIDPPHTLKPIDRLLKIGPTELTRLKSDNTRLKRNNQKLLTGNESNALRLSITELATQFAFPQTATAVDLLPKVVLTEFANLKKNYQKLLTENESLRIELNTLKPSVTEPPTQSASTYCVTWDIICFAAAHEMWSALSIALNSIISQQKIKNDDLTQKTIDYVLDYLKTKRNLLNEPLNYLKNLIKRAITYHDENNYHNTKLMLTENKDIIDEYDDKQWNGLNLSLLRDVFDVRRCFIFTNFYFEEYESTHFIKDINNNNGNLSNNFYQKYLSTVKFESPFNFYPQFIINDDIFAIFKYLFGGSYYVHKLRNNTKRKTLKLKMLIRCKKIQSIYNENILFDDGIDDIFFFFLKVT